MPHPHRLLAALAAAGLAGALLAEDGPAETARADGLEEADLEFFEKEVRPLLAAHCDECHSRAAARVKGGLLLDSKPGWEHGGDSGPALVPGDPDASLLVQAVRYGGAVQMPPAGKLAEREIAVLEDWVRRGAPDPRTEAPKAASAKARDFAAERKHWAYQPLWDGAPPTSGASGASGADDAIDAFLDRARDAAGLAAAPEADRRTLLRRATFDLTGLPPTPAELDAFLADRSPDAWSKVVERLLASPHYGERWGRLWLDLARYADSNGVDENLALGNAWHYRDYVVRAFNQDKPYDRFVAEQLAGDLLPDPGDEEQRFDQWTATGFLVLGPKMLAEQDKDKLAMDIVDEQIDVVGKAFLGLTLGCARCHDHKFDAVPTRDYYALAGILKSTSTMANWDHVSHWRERPLATDEELARVRRWKDEKAAAEKDLVNARAAAEATLLPAWRARLADHLLAAARVRESALLVEAEDFERGNLNVDSQRWGHPDVTVVHTAKPGLQFVEYDVTPRTPGLHRLEVRYAAVDARPMRLLVNGALVRDDALGATTGSWTPDTQTWERVAEVRLEPGTNVVRLERDASTPHLDQLVFVPLAEAGEAGEWPDPAQWADVVPEPEGLRPPVVRRWAFWLARAEREHDPLLGAFAAFAALLAEDFETQARALADALLSAHRDGTQPLHPALAARLAGAPPASLRALAERWQAALETSEAAWNATVRAAADAHAPAPTPDADTAAVLRVLGGDWGPFALTRRELDGLWAPEALERVALAERHLADVAAREPAPFASVLCVQDGAPADVPVHIRGNHLTLEAEAVPRGFLSALVESVPDLPIAAGESGRLELARWITHPANPLTPRVLVNRVWQGHFGYGLVRTASNFGVRGERPTHPELLDWLARTFVEDGWSLKALHRRILHSAAYRMRSALPEDTDGPTLDPENRLLWAFPRRRLDVEELRDALLAASGRIDLTLGGSLLTTPNGGYVTNDQSNNQARYAAPRRALYMPLIRNAMYDLFAAFDYNDPSVPVERRGATTVAHQTLHLLNSPLARESAQAFAESLWSARGRDDDARLDEAYRRALGRLPSSAERERAHAFLADMTDMARDDAGALAAAPSAEGPASSQGGRREEPSDAAPDASVLRAWQGLCMALCASNEFLYVD